MTVEKLKIQNLSEEDYWDYENGFHWFSHPTRLGRFMAHYHLYNEIVDLPGDVFELGVYKLVSLIHFATFRRFLENDFSRKIVGFDAFGKFPRNDIRREADLQFISQWESEGGDGISIEEANMIIKRKGFDNIDLVLGDVRNSLPTFLDSRPEVRISLLHLDMDVAEPTKLGLDLLYEKVVPGGIIMIDDYTTVLGATEVIDKFVKFHNLEILKLPFYSTPSFIKKT